MRKRCFLTMDLENDCGGRLGAIYETVNELNCDKIVGFISKLNVPLTVFVTGQIFEQKPDIIEKLSSGLKRIEFGLHSYSHPIASRDCGDEIRRGADAYRACLKTNPKGYRAPQGRISDSDFEQLKMHGFEYDASIFPTIRPGVFNHLRYPNHPFYMKEHRLTEIPGSVFPLIRIPMGLGYMRMLGVRLTRFLFSTWRLPENVVIVFHLHDVVQSCSADRLRGEWRYFYRKNVDKGFEMLSDVVNLLKQRGYEFDLMENLLSAVSK